MTDTSEPTLTWESAPQQFREAHEKSVADLRAVIDERAKLQRELAMAKAGVDSQHPAFPYFDAGYTGKLDPEAIKAEWAKIAPSGQTTPTPGTPQEPQAVDDGPDPATLAQLQELQEARDRLGSGAIAPGEEPSPDPTAEMLRQFHAARADGLNRDQAQRRGLQALMDAAVAGDPRVAFPDGAAQMAAWRQAHGED